mmetsp:Transcript_164399/g.527240  ORF Transcript_164399/g.527240 Transcript_164399/m.527240 type:complete len:128 (+) Transcript_164399:348-731(+)
MWDVLHRPLAFSFLWSNLPKNQLWLFFPWLVLVGPVPYILAVCLLKIPGVEMDTCGLLMNTSQTNILKVRSFTFRWAASGTRNGRSVQLLCLGTSITSCSIARWIPGRRPVLRTWQWTPAPMPGSSP